MRRFSCTRLLAIAAAVLALTTALLVTVTAPASAATGTPVSVTDRSGGAKATVTYTYGGGWVNYTLKVCDIKADGHHAEGELDHVVHYDDGTNGSIATHRIAEYDGYNHCATFSGSVSGGSSGCEIEFALQAWNMEGSTVIGTSVSWVWDVYAC